MASGHRRVPHLKAGHMAAPTSDSASGQQSSCQHGAVHTWRKTPRQVFLLFKGASERRIREHNDRMQLAFVTAKLTAYAPQKSDKFVKLDALLHKPEGPARPRQTPDQQIEVLRSILAGRRRKAQ